MLNPTIDSMATIMPPPMSSIRVLFPWDIAMNTMTPIEPIIGMTVIRTFPMPAASG